MYFSLRYFLRYFDSISFKTLRYFFAVWYRKKIVQYRKIEAVLQPHHHWVESFYYAMKNFSHPNSYINHNINTLILARLIQLVDQSEFATQAKAYPQCREVARCIRVRRNASFSDSCTL